MALIDRMAGTDRRSKLDSTRMSLKVCMWRSLSVAAHLIRLRDGTVIASDSHTISDPDHMMHVKRPWPALSRTDDYTACQNLLAGRSRQLLGHGKPGYR